MFNSHPAKVFMGDLGSLALGGALASMAILTRHEMSLALIGGVFVIETLSSMIQIIAIRKFKKKVFLKAPLTINSTLSGISIFFRPRQLKNIEFGIFVIFFE